MSLFKIVATLLALVYVASCVRILPEIKNGHTKATLLHENIKAPAPIGNEPEHKHHLKTFEKIGAFTPDNSIPTDLALQISHVRNKRGVIASCVGLVNGVLGSFYSEKSLSIITLHNLDDFTDVKALRQMFEKEEPLLLQHAYQIYRLDNTLLENNFTLAHYNIKDKEILLLKITVNDSNLNHSSIGSVPAAAAFLPPNSTLLNILNQNFN